MVRKGGGLTHKCSGINSSKVCDSNNHKRVIKNSNSLEDRQRDCTFISFENGGYRQQRTLDSCTSASSFGATFSANKLQCQQSTESRNAKDNSEWKLDVSFFQEILTHMGQPTLDLFASRFCHQLPRYIARKPDSGILAKDAFLYPWDREYGFAFPPFSLISRALRKILEEKIDHLIIVAPTWQTQPWYDQLLKMPVQPPFLLPQVRNLLKNPQSKKHPLLETGSLRLAVWKVSGKVCKWKKFQAMLPNLSHIQGEKAQQLITNRPGVSGLAGVMKDKLIHFKQL